MALIIATELLVSLIYKLRMFGIDIDGPADVLWQSVSDGECDITTVSSEQEAQLNILSQSPWGTRRICYYSCLDPRRV